MHTSEAVGYIQATLLCTMGEDSFQLTERSPCTFVFSSETHCRPLVPVMGCSEIEDSLCVGKPTVCVCYLPFVGLQGVVVETQFQHHVCQ